MSNVPKATKKKVWQITVFAMKCEENDLLSVFDDADSLASFLEDKEWIGHVEWIKPVRVNVTAPGVEDET